jgi:hypothetical protein
MFRLNAKYVGSKYRYWLIAEFEITIQVPPISPDCPIAEINIDDTKFKADTLDFTMTQSIW